MRKLSYFVAIIFAALLMSCNEDDYLISQNEETTLSNRNEQFFTYNDSAKLEKKTPSISITPIIKKLKNLNNQTNFVCNLSDQKGLPAWNYAYIYEKKGNVNKGGEEGEDFLIVPLVEEGSNYISSLLFIDNYNSDNPTTYTITNAELLDFINNPEFEKNERESVLMTFFYFDRRLFDDKRMYGNIPADLFESIPTEEGQTSKNINFEFEPEISETDPQICILFEVCPGICDCDCYTAAECYWVGGGGFYGSGGNNNNSGGDHPWNNNDGGGNGGGNPNSPWYIAYPNYLNYTHHLQNLLARLWTFTLDDYATAFLQQPENIGIINSANVYLSTNPTQQKRIITRWAINYLIDHPNATFSSLVNDTQTELNNYFGEGNWQFISHAPSGAPSFDSVEDAYNNLTGGINSGSGGEFIDVNDIDSNERVSRYKLVFWTTLLGGERGVEILVKQTRNDNQISPNILGVATVWFGAPYYHDWEQSMYEAEDSPTCPECEDITIWGTLTTVAVIKEIPLQFEHNYEIHLVIKKDGTILLPVLWWRTDD